MNYKIHITKTAETDLNTAIDYIEFTLLNPQAADNLLDKTVEAINKLSYMPQIHSLVEDSVLNAWGIRFIVINNYITFFTIDEQLKTVYILRYIYGKRNWIEILKSEPLSIE